MIFYCKKSNGFYLSKLHRDAIPDGAVEITEKEYEDLKKGQASGQLITSNDAGWPILTDQPPLSKELVESSARAARDEAIASSMWIAERHRSEVSIGADSTITEQQYIQLLTYHQSLRDWPAQPGWPDIDMPPEPDWLAELKK
ncbi:phage tail assembly chaperone [Aeromonas jandaei]|uniref:Tail fiber assembly protein n=1 Tax=Aeromonas jandaei TaxID=650 RepID=A0A7T4AC42_AERJA|nr:phage tail assembly chaperone [Aeromonas jandaei]QQB21190.1 tail fiber assembly protein [Aeromonas jandaei]UCA32006.1 phage tail assembly chaperone [Aeromonas jandaei]